MDTLRKCLWGWCLKRSCCSSPILSQCRIWSDDFVVVMAIGLHFCCLMGSEPQKDGGKWHFYPTIYGWKYSNFVTSPNLKGKEKFLIWMEGDDLQFAPPFLHLSILRISASLVSKMDGNPLLYQMGILVCSKNITHNRGLRNFSRGPNGSNKLGNAALLINN